MDKDSENNDVELNSSLAYLKELNDLFTEDKLDRGKITNHMTKFNSFLTGETATYHQMKKESKELQEENINLTKNINDIYRTNEKLNGEIYNLKKGENKEGNTTKPSINDFTLDDLL